MTDPLDLLRSADPARTSDPSTLDREGLYRHITETTSNDHLFDAPPTQAQVESLQRRPRKTRFLAGAVAAGVAGALGLGVASLLPTSTTPAAAAMVSAAAATGAFDSGVVTVTVSVDEADDATSLSLLTRFDGDDLATSFVSANGQAAGFVPDSIEARVIDGDIYMFNGDEWFVVDDARVRAGLEATGFPTSVGDTTAAVLDLVKAADGVEEVEPGRFVGVVTVDELRELQLTYPGLSAVTGEAGDELGDEELNVELVLDADGAIDIVTVRASEDTTTGTLVFDYADLGSDQLIERPADATSFDFGLDD